MAIIRRRFDRSYFNLLARWRSGRSPRNLKRLQLILEQNDGGRLLDIGIGSGDFLELAATRFDVRAIDISPYAGARLPRALRQRIMVGNIESMRLPPSTYNVITAFNVLEHLHDPARVIRKLASRLAAGGVLVGSMPHNAGFIGRLYTRITEYFDRTHISCLEASEWRKAFAEAGFRSTRYFGEVVLDGALCLYLFGPMWKHLSLNMMFVARKPT